MTATSHDVNNSQCDLNMYGPDPGDGSVKCTCDEDAPIEPAVGPARPVSLLRPDAGPRTIERELLLSRDPGAGPQPNVVTLTGRAATTHIELRAAGHELRAAQDLFTKAQARYKAALDAHMQELA